MNKLENCHTMEDVSDGPSARYARLSPAALGSKVLGLRGR